LRFVVSCVLAGVLPLACTDSAEVAPGSISVLTECGGAF
jgi:hypothetical protein